MAPSRSFVAVTAGSGTKLGTFNYTDGADSKHDELVAIGEQGLLSYTVTTPGVSTATGASHVLQIMAGASLKVRIRRIELHQVAAATAAVLSDWNLMRLTTAGTGGGVVTPSALEQGDAASGATAMTLPTVKGTETVAIAAGNPYLIQTIGASTPFVTPIMTWDFDRLRSKSLVIGAGATNGIAVKNVGAYAGATVRVLVWFDESPY